MAFKIRILKGRCLNSLKRVEKKMTGAAVIIAYDTHYAVYVHEDTERVKQWSKPGTGPKFLENPARDMANSNEISNIVNAEISSGKSLSNGLMKAGRAVLKASRAVCPIDTKTLYKSSRVRKDPSVIDAESDGMGEEVDDAGATD